MNNRTWIFMMIMIAYMLPNHSYGATVFSATCSNEDVQAAINSAEDGDTVAIPGCPSGMHWAVGFRSHDLSRCHSPEWGCAGIVIPDSKGLTLKGQGPNQTLIIVDIAVAVLAMTSEDNSPLDISGLGFIPGTGRTEQGVIVMRGQAKDWRVHHNRFGTADTPFPHRSFWIGHVYGDCTYGLWDHNEHHSFQAVPGLVSMGSCYGGNFGDGVWRTQTNWGGEDWMFFEDNDFYAYGNTGHGGGGPDNLGASKVVFRHNYVDETYPTHGAESSGRPRGHRASEIYNNVFNARTNIPGAISLRAGTFRIYNNTISGPYQNLGNVWIANWDNSRGLPFGNCRDSPAEGLCSGDNETSCIDDADCGIGPCNRVHDPPGSIGGDGDGLGYPCRDQAGRGLDAGVTTPQALEPIYSWSNTGSATNLYATTGGTTENIDFHNCIDYAGCIGKGMEPFSAYPYPHPLAAAGIAHCGNGVCDDGEDTETCPEDCQALQCIHKADNDPCDGVISIQELNAYIKLWKTTDSASMTSLMQAVRFWKS